MTTKMGLDGAPRDGTPFLARNSAGHWLLARFTGHGFEAAALDGTPPGDITGWAPLPPPPATDPPARGASGPDNGDDMTEHETPAYVDPLPPKAFAVVEAARAALTALRGECCEPNREDYPETAAAMDVLAAAVGRYDGEETPRLPG